MNAEEGDEYGTINGQAKAQEEKLNEERIKRTEEMKLRLQLSSHHEVKPLVPYDISIFENPKLILTSKANERVRKPPEKVATKGPGIIELSKSKGYVRPAQ